MDFQNMREFVVLMETKNYLEAAEQLYISQATLSRHIIAMEREVGGKLFERSTRRVELTPLGILFYPYAKKAVELQDEYQEIIRNELNMAKETVQLGVMESWRKYPLQQLLLDFQKKRPHAHIDFQVMKNGRILENIMLGKTHLGVVREMDEDHADKLERIPLYRDNLMVYLPEAHKLVHEEVIHPEQLQDEVFLLPEEASIAYRLSSRICLEAGFVPQYSFKGVVGEDMFRYIKKGLGITILLAANGKAVQTPGVVGIELASPVRTFVNLVYNRQTVNETEKQFVIECKKIQL